MKNGSSAILEFDFRRKDGTLFRGEASASLIRDTAGNPSGFVTVTRDITERKKTEEALKQNEADLKALLNSIQTGILVIDPDTHRIVQANNYAMKMIGVETDQLTGHVCHNFICPANKGNCPITDLHQKVDVSERVLLNNRHEKIPVLKSVVPLVRNGKEYLVESFVDITERVKAEKALRESERKYSLIAESTIDYIAILNLKGEYIYMSPAVKRLGYTPEELIGRSSFDFVHPEDRRVLLPLVAKYTGMKLKELFGLKNDSFSVTMSYRFRDKQNNWTYMESVASGIESSDGKGIDILVVSRDMTEKRQAETELRIQKELTDRSLNIIPNGIAVIDNNLQILLANKAFEQNHNSNRSIKGNQITETKIPSNIIELVKKVADGKSTEEKMEYRSETSEGDKTFLAMILSIGEGQVLLTISDLTKEREQEAKMYLTERLASVGEMASGIAHELNNPLTSVIGLSALLAEENLPGNIGEDVQAICQEARRASSIVKNLLSFARRHEPKRQPTQINDVVTDVLKLRTYEQKANNIHVTTNFGPNLPEVMADNFQMQQAFLNIILNAEQAMHEANGKGHFEIAVERRGGMLRITFTDDGPGIKPANRKRIFDPFFTTKEVGKGTGLGLSITYGIIKSHDGKIWVESEPGHGATFIVEIPVYIGK
jgi:PAS domain S-box-containing protein